MTSQDFGGVNTATPPQVRPAATTDIVETYGAGHGWGILGTTLATAADDTSDGALSGQSVRLVTKLATSGSFEKSGLTVNATGKTVRLWVKIDDPANMVELNVYAGNADFSAFYLWTAQAAEAGDAQRWARPDEWVAYTLSFHDAAPTGAPDRAAITRIRVRIKDAGQSALTVHLGGIDLVPEPAAGVVTVAFDDVYDSVWSMARPKLVEHGLTAICYVICDAVGTAGYMTLDQLRRLHRLHGWEMGAHSYSTAGHAAGLDTSEGLAVYEMTMCRQWIADNGLGPARHFAYPLGGYTATTVDVARQRFTTARTVHRRTKGETVPPADPHRLRSMSVGPSDTAAAVNAQIDKAVANKSWLLLTFHDLVEADPGASQYLRSSFDTIIDHLASSGATVATPTAVLG